MGNATTIAWTHYTFNPWWGCTRVSPGCQHCYAAAFSHRLGLDVWGPQAGRRTFDDRHWDEPLRWSRRRAAGDERHLVFCASMADVFEDRRDLDSARFRLWDLIQATPELTWQLVTKRPENVDRLAPGAWTMHAWPSNVWLLVTAEDQERADLRIPVLLRTGARVKGVSYEPALGPVDFSRWMWPVLEGWPAPYRSLREAREAGAKTTRRRQALVSASMVFLDWVIVGGESGPGARPFDVAWARSVVRQCREAGVACFVKQVGANVRTRNDSLSTEQDPDVSTDWPAPADGWGRIDENLDGYRDGYQGAPIRIYLKHPKGGAMEEWPADLRIREFPHA